MSESDVQPVRKLRVPHHGRALPGTGSWMLHVVQIQILAKSGDVIQRINPDSDVGLETLSPIDDCNESTRSAEKTKKATGVT